jgi:hypothetical protein
MRLGLMAAAAALGLCACGPTSPQADATAEPTRVAAINPTPTPSNGWREYPLRPGVIAIEPAAFRTETIDIPLNRGAELEYKLQMRQGQTIVYSISYPGIEHPGHVVSEFHGHTPKGADGIGDLMFYSKAAGATQHGSFTAPWDGIHGWYLKNDGQRDLVVKLEVAGFYEHTT